MGNTIGIDVGGTKVLGGVVDENGKILATARKETPRQGGAELTRTIAETAKELMEKFDVTSVGVSAALFLLIERQCLQLPTSLIGMVLISIQS
jgi:glucokinase